MENDNNDSSSSEDSKSDTGIIESVDDATMEDNNGVDGTEEGSNKDTVMLRANGHDAVFSNKTRPALDKMVLKPDRTRWCVPEYEERDKKLIQSSLCIKALDKIDSKKQYPLINTRALFKEAPTYELETFDKHTLVIFNQEEIDGLPRMYGTEKDVESLTRTFKKFGFEVKIHNNLTKGAIFRELQKFSQKDFTDYGCVAVAILTHGGGNGMLWAKDQLYDEIEVIKHFGGNSNVTLVSKPKIFIIEDGGDSGGPGFVQQSGKICKPGEEEPYYIRPQEPDLLILHSAYPGHPSFRDIHRGSWFIHILCEKIDTLASTHDLESIITEVKRGMAIEKQYNNGTLEMKVTKQMPVMTSTLIRKLYLKKFREQDLEETHVDKSRRRSESRHEVSDAVSYSIMTARMDESGPSSCFLEHFTYMRNCLRNFVAENPNDETAQAMLDIANTYEDSIKFKKAKDIMCKVISNYLMDKAQNSQISKYLHSQSKASKVTKFRHGQKEISVTPKSSFSSLDICLTGIFAASAVLLFRNVKSY